MEVKPAFREVTAGHQDPAPDRQSSGALARVLALPAPTVPLLAVARQPCPL